MLAVAGILALLFPLSSAAAAECHASASESKYPKASMAIQDWEDRNSTKTLLVRSRILEEFCEEATAIGSERQLDARAIDNVASVAVEEYLDRMIDLKRSARSFGAILRSALGVQGFSRPAIRLYGVLFITYTRAVDSIQVQKTEVGQVSKVVVPVGRVHVEGWRQSVMVCGGDVTISISSHATFNC